MGEYMGDSWDGFDSQAHIYDEKKDKKWNSGIWKLIACLSALMLIYIFYNQMKEILLIKQGICIDAEYDETKMLARYIDEDGQLYMYNLNAYDPEVKDGHVKLYYRYNIHAAKPKSDVLSIIKDYAFFAILFGVSAWRIWKIYKS